MRNIPNGIRYPLLVLGVSAFTLSVGFFLQAPWATWIWPWPDSRLSYVFVSSIFAAISLPILWICLAAEAGSAQSAALDLTVNYGGFAGYLFLLSLSGERAALIGYAVFYAVLTAAAVGIAIWSRRHPIRDARPMPGLVRLSFGGFAAVLVLVSVLLLLQVPNVFPWPLLPESSVMFSRIFMGAAVYFVHGLLWPSWSNAAGQLVGFLAYDVVLIGPFLGHFADVRPEHRLSLTVYVVVILYSSALSIYYLFVNGATRLGARWREERSA